MVQEKARQMEVNAHTVTDKEVTSLSRYMKDQTLTILTNTVVTTSPIHFHASLSSNRKTGNILVTTSSANTCPPSCSHLKLGTCYAKFSFLGLHWNKVNNGTRSIGLPKLLESISNLKPGSVWRYNQAGDLPGIGEDVDETILTQITNASKGKRGFTYTHKLKKLKVLQKYNTESFTINLSADSLEQAVKLHNTSSCPVVITSPSKGYESTSFKYKSIDFVTCPTYIREGITCKTCKMCAIHDRRTIIMFPAHGTAKNKWK